MQWFPQDITTGFAEQFWGATRRSSCCT